MNGMTNALYVLLLLALLGAFDTLYYHEWRLRLPSDPSARQELRLHAVWKTVCMMVGHHNGILRSCRPSESLRKFR